MCTIGWTSGSCRLRPPSRLHKCPPFLLALVNSSSITAVEAAAGSVRWFCHDALLAAGVLGFEQATNAASAPPILAGLTDGARDQFLADLVPLCEDQVAAVSPALSAQVPLARLGIHTAFQVSGPGAAPRTYTQPPSAAFCILALVACPLLSSPPVTSLPSIQPSF